MKVVTWQNRLPRKAVDVPLLEVFKAEQNGLLDSLITARNLEVGIFNCPKLSHDNTNHYCLLREEELGRVEHRNFSQTLWASISALSLHLSLVTKLNARSFSYNIVKQKTHSFL